MFFLVRAAVCIGAVALVAAGGDKAGLPRVVDTAGRDAAQSLGQACVASDDCLRIGMGLVATAARIDPGRRIALSDPSVDTLTALDLRPAWNARGGRPAAVSAHLHQGTLARL